MSSRQVAVTLNHALTQELAAIYFMLDPNGFVCETDFASARDGLARVLSQLHYPLREIAQALSTIQANPRLSPFDLSIVIRGGNPLTPQLIERALSDIGWRWKARGWEYESIPPALQRRQTLQRLQANFRAYDFEQCVRCHRQEAVIEWYPEQEVFRYNGLLFCASCARREVRLAKARTALWHWLLPRRRKACALRIQKSPRRTKT